MVTITSGLLGGLLGAIASGAATAAWGEDVSPAGVVWAMYFGDGDPANYRVHGAVVHVIYGAIAGAVFATATGASAAVFPDLGSALLWAIGWSALLAVVAIGFWLTVVVGEEPTRSLVAVTSGAHLVFGIVLGLVVYAVPAI